MSDKFVHLIDVVRRLGFQRCREVYRLVRLRKLPRPRRYSPRFILFEAAKLWPMIEAIERERAEAAARVPDFIREMYQDSSPPDDPRRRRKQP